MATIHLKAGLLTSLNLWTEKPVLFVAVYQSPASARSEFLSEFFNVVSDLVFRTDKVIFVGDF